MAAIIGIVVATIALLAAGAGTLSTVLPVHDGGLLV